MPFTDSEVRSLTATDKMQKKSVGDCLYVIVEPARKGGGKSFYGELRHPPGGGGKKVRVCIGPYGRGVGKWSLKDARTEWNRIRSWSLETGRDPRELKKEEKEHLQQWGSGPTFSELVEDFLAVGCHQATQTDETQDHSGLSEQVGEPDDA